MKKILFPFYNQEIYLSLSSKKWFKFALVMFPIIVILITFKTIFFFADNLYLYCYDDLHAQQKQQTFNAAREINDLDFTNSGSELKAQQIIQKNDEWFNNKIEECRVLADKYSVYIIPVGIVALVSSFYFVQLFFFMFIKKGL